MRLPILRPNHPPDDQRVYPAPSFTSTMGVTDMSKGMDQKKEAKKKPAKNLKEKRAEKKAKKAARGF